MSNLCVYVMKNCFLGKRNCVAQSLAEVELFLYFANLVHDFKIEPAEGHPINVHEQRFTATLLPKHEPILKVTSRNKVA